jgi:hypothetical protein
MIKSNVSESFLKFMLELRDKALIRVAQISVLPDSGRVVLPLKACSVARRIDTIRLTAHKYRIKYGFGAKLADCSS